MEPWIAGILGVLFGGLITAGGLHTSVVSRVSKVETRVEDMSEAIRDLRDQTDARIFEAVALAKEVLQQVREVTKQNTVLIAEIRAVRKNGGKL
jgi:hypothetical protein